MSIKATYMLVIIAIMRISLISRNGDPDSGVKSVLTASCCTSYRYLVRSSSGRSFSPGVKALAMMLASLASRALPASSMMLTGETTASRQTAGKYSE